MSRVGQNRVGKCTVSDCTVYSDFLAKNTVNTLYMVIWLWPTLSMCVRCEVRGAVRCLKHRCSVCCA